MPASSSNRLVNLREDQQIFDAFWKLLVNAAALEEMKERTT
jgi:hypothetical protein